MVSGSGVHGGISELGTNGKLLFIFIHGCISVISSFRLAATYSHASDLVKCLGEPGRYLLLLINDSAWAALKLFEPPSWSALKKDRDQQWSGTNHETSSPFSLIKGSGADHGSWEEELEAKLTAENGKEVPVVEESSKDVVVGGTIFSAIDKVE